MSYLRQGDPVSTGIEELIALLSTNGGSQQPQVKAGYVDVLGNSDPIGPHRGQQVFRKRTLARIYERLWRPLVSRFFFGFGGPKAKEEMRIAVGRLEVSAGDRVIDVGCGPGNYTPHLAEAADGGLVVGMDASEAMIAMAAKWGGGANLAYLRGDARALPFADAEFDAACCVGVIHMIEKPMEALDEMVRILAPGGRLAIVASCGPAGAPARVRGGVTIFARDELTSALKERGFLDIEQRIVRRGQFVSARKAAA